MGKGQPLEFPISPWANCLLQLKSESGSNSGYATITNIAPTLSILLHIRLPNGATGQPVHEIFE